MLLLAFDTATPAITVAVHDGTSVVAQAGGEGATAHGEQLAPAIREALAQAGLVPADLTDVAVGVGPGPFTGLRVGVVTALTLGATLGLRTHGVCTLDVLAAELAATGRIVRVAAAPDGLLGWSSTSVVAETADLLRVAVDPSTRGRGLGRLLVDDVLHRATESGAERVLLEVAEPNTAARGLYAATGFREIHRRRRYYADGADALVLERVLP